MVVHRRGIKRQISAARRKNSAARALNLLNAPFKSSFMAAYLSRGGRARQKPRRRNPSINFLAYDINARLIKRDLLLPLTGEATCPEGETRD